MDRREKNLFWITTFFYLLVVLLFGYLHFRNGIQSAVSQIDATLRVAASALDEILERDFHDRYNLDHPIHPEDYRAIVGKLDRLVARLGIEYVYSMVELPYQNQKRIYFVVSNETEEDRKRGTPSVFYNPYPEPPDALKQAFKTETVVFAESYTNTWSSFRSIFIPAKTARGLVYVLASDMKTQDMRTLTLKVSLETLWISTLFLTPLLMSALYYTRYQKERKKELLNQIYVDSLTGLYNQNQCVVDFKSSLPAYLAIIDLNRFSQLIELYGEKTGQQLVIHFGRHLRKNISNNSIIKTQAKEDIQFLAVNPSSLLWHYAYFHDIFRFYKLSSDCFCLAILREWTEDELESFLSEFATAISQFHFFYQDTFTIQVVATIGVIRKDQADNITHMISRGYIAREHAKQHQIDYAFYHPSMGFRQKQEDILIIARNIRKALDEDRIVCYFQPIVDCQTREVVKYESLVRMMSEQGEVISPFHFLDVAKKTQLYPEISQRVITKSLQAVSQFHCAISLNLSFDDLVHRKTIDILTHQLTLLADKHKVTLEIVESEEIGDYRKAGTILEIFHNQGCPIAVDDFGSGYSNFEHLFQLHVDYIKIDGSLIKEILTSHRARAIVSSIVSFARQVNIKTIAEFVSSPEIFDAMLALEIDYAQGYYLGKPEALPKSPDQKPAT